MKGPEQTRSDHPAVTDAQVQSLGTAHDIGANQAADRSRPDGPVDFSSQDKQRNYRHQRDVEGGQKSGVGYRGMENTVLLQGGGGKEYDTGADDAQPVDTRKAPVPAPHLSVLTDRPGQNEAGPDQHPDSGKAHGLQATGSHLLNHGRWSPR